MHFEGVDLERNHHVTGAFPGIVCLDQAFFNGTGNRTPDPAKGQTPPRGILLTPILSCDQLAGRGLPSPVASLLAENQGETVLGISLDLDIPDPGQLLSLLPQWVENGLRLVHWHHRKDPGAVARDLLWRTACMDIWNHVDGTIVDGTIGEGTDSDWPAFALDNPYIVHSHGKWDRTAPVATARYGETRPLPGVPRWTCLGGMAELLAQLAGTPAKALAAQRWETETGTVRQMGTELDFQYLSPPDIKDKTLEEICRMVGAGGSVDLTHVRANLERAHCIAVAVENGIIVGNSSLKHPRRAFVDYLLDITGLDFTGFVERGYTSVRPEYRAFGVGRRLLEGLTARAGRYRVFSLIDEDNRATQKIALRNQTEKLLVYNSPRSGKAMGLWMPSAMVETMDPDWHDRLAAFRDSGGRK